MSSNNCDVLLYRLRKNYEAIARDLEPRQVLNYLYQEDVIDSGVRDDVRAEKTERRSAEVLLKCLENRGSSAVEQLIVGLQRSSQKHLAEILKTPLQGEDSYRQSSSVLSHSVPDDEEYYKMSYVPCGFAIIVNNYLFDDDSGLEFRDGSTKDVQKLTCVFQKLNFTVILKNNLTADDIRAMVREYSLEDHTYYSCFVLFFMSHGSEEGIFSTDGKTLQLQEDIVSKFNAENCPTLASKPKLFFVQACRGRNPDVAVTVTDGPRRPPPTNRPPFPEPRSTVLDEKMTTGPPMYPSGTSQSALLPRETDIFIGFASSPKLAAMRNTWTGGWYVKTLADVFLKYAKKEDLLSMMTRVNRIVNQQYDQTGEGNHIVMQAPEQQSRLRMKLYFNVS